MVNSDSTPFTKMMLKAEIHREHSAFYDSLLSKIKYKSDQEVQELLLFENVLGRIFDISLDYIPCPSNYCNYRLQTQNKRIVLKFFYKKCPDYVFYFCLHCITFFRLTVFDFDKMNAWVVYDGRNAIDKKWEEDEAKESKELVSKLSSEARQKLVELLSKVEK